MNFGSLLPIIAGLGLTAATGGLAAPALAAGAAGAAAPAAGAALGAGAAGAAEAALPAALSAAAPAIAAPVVGAGTEAAAPLLASAASAAPVATGGAAAALPGAAADIAPGMAARLAPEGADLLAPSIAPHMASMPSTLADALPEGLSSKAFGFADKAAGWLGRNPLAPMAAASMLMGGSNKEGPKPPALSAAPVYTAPAGNTPPLGPLPQRQFQQALISNLSRR